VTEGSTNGNIKPKELPVGARVLVGAAKELLLEEGFAGLSLDKISRRAKKNKAMVRHYFGGKEGLLAALVDDLFYDAVTGLVRHTESLPEGEERLHVFLERSRELLDKAEFRAFFDILPHALREPALRDQIAELYVEYRSLNKRCLNAANADNGVCEPLASLIVAVVDGLTIQAALDPAGFCPEEPFNLLESMARQALASQQAPSPALG
jgi:TetR/AcrR family transcriptional regulator, transcriptional repressor of aconitase